MQITINGNNVNIIFGIRFLRELDKIAPVQINNVSFGAGLAMKVPELYAGNIATLADVLYAGTVTEKNRPTQDMVDNFVENHSDLDNLFDEVLKELEETTAGKRIIAKMRENLN